MKTISNDLDTETETFVDSGDAPAPTREVPEKVIKHADRLSVNYKGLYLRASKGECSPRQAIKAHCQFCVGYEQTVERIRDCASLTCPVYAYRPYQG